MTNLIETATLFQTELDKAAIEGATSGWMEQNASLIKYDGGEEVKIPRLDMDGLGDYTDTFPDGGVSLKFETKKMEMDRGRRFIIPETAVENSKAILTMSSLMGEFQRTKVIPELDAYRYSKIATTAIANNHLTSYTPTEADILKKLYYDIAQVQDIVGEIPLVITMNAMVAAILDCSSTISKKLDIVDFKQGNVQLKVSSLNSQYPIIRVGSSRMKTKYTFYDGRTASDGAEQSPSPDQTGGGFAPTEDAKEINWIITPQNAPLAVSRTDKMRIFDPETYQPSRSWATDFRKFHDLWIKHNSISSIFVNVKG